MLLARFSVWPHIIKPSNNLHLGRIPSIFPHLQSPRKLITRELKTLEWGDGYLYTRIPHLHRKRLLRLSSLALDGLIVTLHHLPRTDHLALPLDVLQLQRYRAYTLPHINDTAGHEPGLSWLSVARILAGRFFNEFDNINGVKLQFWIRLEQFVPKVAGDFEVRLLIRRKGFNNFRITLTNRLQLDVAGFNTKDVHLHFRRPDIIVPRNPQSLIPGSHQHVLHEYGDDLLMPIPGEEETSPYSLFSYEAALISELNDHFPLYIGEPALKAQTTLNLLAASLATKIAPKDYWSSVQLTLPDINPLEGSRFGLDEKMETSFKHSSVDVPSPTATVHRAVIALGSNIGNRIQHIENALTQMEERGLVVQKVSSLYETKAMYVLNQDAFLNGVCEIQTTLKPMELLDVLQDIENSLGRVKIIDKGPRNIDLDILLYDQERISNDRLIVPHKLMLEREFVLEPLAQLMPSATLPPPQDTLSFRTHHLMLRKQTFGEPRPHPVVYVHEVFPLLKPHQPDKPTHVMAILNITPDSFSDAGSHFEKDSTALAETIKSFIKAGATIIDVGGQSTRPNAVLLGAKEEINRVIPVIKLIRSLPEAKNIAISVDTFYARVAKASIDAGADIINDISGGDLDTDMFPTVAAMGKTIIISHTRGDPSTMNSLTDYDHGVVAGVAEELFEKVQAALEAGIRPWRIILDPGIGFAKTHEQNLELLRSFQHLSSHKGLQYYPWLIGTSRKKFVGTATGVTNAQDRIWGTAATVTSAIREGADMVRVHDVKEMVQVAKMSDAIYRVASGHEINMSTPKSPQINLKDATPDEASSTHPRRKQSKAQQDANQFFNALLGDNANATDGLNTLNRK